MSYCRTSDSNGLMMDVSHPLFYVLCQALLSKYAYLLKEHGRLFAITDGMHMIQKRLVDL